MFTHIITSVVFPLLFLQQKGENSHFLQKRQINEKFRLLMQPELLVTRTRIELVLPP